MQKVDHHKPALFAAIFVMGLILFANHAEAGWPKVESPPQTQTTNFAQEMFYQGIPMRIKTFNSKISKQRVLEFYRDKWDKKYLEDWFGPWKQISHQKNNYFITIQVQSSGEESSYGRISVMQIPDKDAPAITLGQGIAVLPETTIVNDVTSNDSNTNSRNVIAHNNHSIESNGNYYQRHYSNKKWGTVLDKTVKQGNRVLVFRKGNKESVVVLQKIGSTSYIQLNESQKKSFFQ